MFHPVDAKNNDLNMSMLMGQEVWPDAIYSSDAQKLINLISKHVFVLIRHYKQEKFTYLGTPEKIAEFEKKHKEYMGKQNL